MVRERNLKDVMESQEVFEKSFNSFRNIPWERIAFPSIVWALNDFHEAVDKDFFPPKKEPPFFFWAR